MNHVTINDVKVGSIITVRGGVGLDPPQNVLLTHVTPAKYNEKGRDIVAYTDDSGVDRWAYLNQITEIVAQ